ncbi:MAG: DUF2891 domain-containing protein [Opitutales bacterium]|nr:DUF2891 domain-containing protein [Opitutales bacterium]
MASASLDNLSLEDPLTQTVAVDLSKLSLNCIHTPYPYKPGHVLFSEADLQEPKQYHPAFYGCFDWHSAVHGHWTLVKLLKTFPEMENAAQIREKLSSSLTAENIQTELAYFQTEGRGSFERMYGWAWLLKLAEEIATFEDPDAQHWHKALKPLCDYLVASYLDFLPKQTYPIRRGVHPNTAFGLAFAWDYAVVAGETELIELIKSRAMDYFAADSDYPAAFEQGGDNFFSPSLMEADLMRRILSPEVFSLWLDKFLPGIPQKHPKNLFEPAFVSDRTDGYIVHLDGLNLSRAWCMAGISKALPKEDPRRKILIESAWIHATTALPELASGHYEGEHWLASFAVYMLSEFKGI